jgi:ATP-binding cassette subfamily F protein uup
LAGEIIPESGERWLRPGTRIAWLQQVLPEADDQTVYDLVASGLVETGRLLAEYHHLVQAEDLTDMNTLARVRYTPARAFIRHPE